MRYLIPLLFATFIISPSCAQLKEQQARQANLLQAAYSSGSREKLDSFFENWSRETPSLSDPAIEKLSDTMRNACKVFQEFYNPLNIQRSGGSEWGNDIYKDVKYLVLQKDISIGFVDALDGDLLLRRAADEYTGSPSEDKAQGHGLYEVHQFPPRAFL